MAYYRMQYAVDASGEELTTHMAGDSEQEMISGGHLVAWALKADGVDVIFTPCGGHTIDSYDGCSDEGIDVADVRHEQVAAQAADGYARITGKPGCALVTAGPGTTDAVERASASGKPSLINVWVDPDVYAPRTMNQTMYK
jgi:thiamine pyrophosphate-dependent acetolactate synthase large subunit-like protein